MLEKKDNILANKLENKLIANHLINLENKGLIGIVRPIDSNWRTGSIHNSSGREVYQVSNSITYNVYPIVEPFNMSTWDLSNSTCLDIYLNWHNDFLKILKPEGIEFRNIDQRGDKYISMREFHKGSHFGDLVAYFGCLILEEHIGNVLEHGFRTLKLDSSYDASITDITVGVGEEKMTLNKLVPFDERIVGEIVRNSYINLYPTKQYAEMPDDVEIPNHYLEIPIKKENKEGKQK